ncbi:MAG: HAD family hydrolase [Clostridiales bacterium]|nr:HAD family hydrolase [Clostridiales bacterium]
MALKAVFFDLDGTLLPMDQNLFIKSYLGSFAQKLVPHGYDPKQFVQAVWMGVAAMVQNDGKRYNESLFWEQLEKIYGQKAFDDMPVMDDFYQNDFDKSKQVCGFNPNAKLVVDEIKNMGLKVVLATNPIFPAIATQKRMSWAGFSPDDFELYTTYENSRFCKPNLEYYKDILSQLDLNAEECLMVGNDVTEDMVAQKLGFKVFLLPACIINMDNKDISCYPQGDFNDLLEYIKQLVEQKD